MILPRVSRAPELRACVAIRSWHRVVVGTRDKVVLVMPIKSCTGPERGTVESGCKDRRSWASKLAHNCEKTRHSGR